MNEDKNNKENRIHNTSKQLSNKITTPRTTPIRKHNSDVIARYTPSVNSVYSLRHGQCNVTNYENNYRTITRNDNTAAIDNNTTDMNDSTLQIYNWTLQQDIDSNKSSVWRENPTPSSNITIRHDIYKYTSIMEYDASMIYIHNVTNTIVIFI